MKISKKSYFTLQPRTGKLKSEKPRQLFISDLYSRRVLPGGYSSLQLRTYTGESRGVKAWREGRERTRLYTDEVGRKDTIEPVEHVSSES